MDVKAYMIEDDVKMLVQIMHSIDFLILSAEKQKREFCINSREVKIWLKKLKDIFDDVDHLIDEFSTEDLRRKNKKDKKVQIFFSSSNQLLVSSKIATKIKDLTNRLKSLKKFSNFNSHPCEQRDSNERESHSFIPEENFIGRENEKKDLIKLLLDTNANGKDNVSVILIIGDEGIGKTALAQFVYNNNEVQRHFELTKWVWVSEVFYITNICEKFIEFEDTNNKSHLAQKVMKEVDGKRYLLVLDDVLNEIAFYWSNLMNILKYGAKGSKIIITTRSKKMKILQTNPNMFITLDKLNEEHSWRMFCLFAFVDEKKVENRNLVSIGKEIVKKCNGIPLAIYNIGRLMYFKKTENDWLKIKNKDFELPTIYEDMCTEL